MEVERIDGRHSREDGHVRARANALADKSYSDDVYLIRPVASVSEMVEESERQHNCLATYVGKVAAGETDIWLMRRASDPDKSLVTVEVRDGAIRQAFRACNEVPSGKELRWLSEWCGRVGYRTHHGRMRALCA